MKTIESLGGPLIGLNRRDIERWGGTDTLNFFSSSNQYRNDYDHLCFEAIEIGGLIVRKSIGIWGEIILINYPIPTVVVGSTRKGLYLAQIDGSELDWDPSELRISDFESGIPWQDPFQIQLKGGELVFFDAASVESDFNGDTLNAIVEAGSYRCEWARQAWEGKADMNFIRIVKEE